MNRWVGLGVIADNVVNIGRAMEKQAAPRHHQVYMPRRSPRRGLRCPARLTTMLQTSILRREVSLERYLTKGNSTD